MSILETFYILFKSDTSEVKKGTEEAEKSTKKLADSLKNVNKESTQIGYSFLNIAHQLTGIVAGFLSIHAVLNGLRSATDYLNDLSQASYQLGVSAEKLDLWGKVLERNGGTIQSFRSSLRSLAEHLGTTADTALKVLPKLADSFHKLNRFQALRYGKMLGLDEATILLLQQGRREVEAQIAKQKELGVVTKEDIEISDKFNDSLLEDKQAFSSLYITLSREILPILTKFFNVLTPIVEYLKRHKDLVIGAFIGIGIAAAIMLAPIIAANAGFLLLVGTITALIGLFAIAYEDIKAYLAGHNSLTGDILKKWPIIKQVVADVFDYWKLRIETFLKILNYLKEKFSKLKSFFSGLFGGNNNIGLNISHGQALLQNAAENPLNTASSQSIFNTRSFDRNTAINTGDIIVNTQATDAVGISKGIGKTLKENLWQANNDFADGVAY